MENGIGRAGYRLLAFVFLALGLLGLGLQWADGATASGTQWIGLVTAVVGLGALAVLAYVLTGSGPSQVTKELSGQRSLDYEYPESTPLATPAPPDPAPAGPPRVEMVPQSTPAATAAAGGPLVQPSIATLRDRYTQGTPMVREILAGGGRPQHKPVPEITARRVPKGARPEQAPAGTSMGRCGSCNTIIYAPTTRPLRLRCPACSKVTLLK